MPNQSEIDALQTLVERAHLARKAGDGAKPYVVVAEDSKIEVLEPLLAQPSRKTGYPNFLRSESFCGYVNQQKTSASRLYVTCSTNIVAVINHHGEGTEGQSGPGWGDHKAQLSLTQTPEWTIWKASNLKKMSQRDFAQFIDDNSEDISGMDGASLLELIRTVKASQQLELTGDVDEKNTLTGSSFTLAAKTKAGAKEGVELPGEFALSISPYEGGDKVAVRVRLRIEICAPKFTLNYDLVKIQKVEREALEQIVVGVAKEVEMTAWYGQP